MGEKDIKLLDEQLLGIRDRLKQVDANLSERFAEETITPTLKVLQEHYGPLRASARKFAEACDEHTVPAPEKGKAAQERVAVLKEQLGRTMQELGGGYGLQETTTKLRSLAKAHLDFAAALQEYRKQRIKDLLKD